MADDPDQYRDYPHSGSWRHVVCLLILALSVSVATRTFPSSFHQRGVSVQSNSTQATRQHMVIDAAKWVIPVSRAVVFQAISFYPGIAPAGPPLPSQPLGESLYDRPPPSSWFFSR